MRSANYCLPLPNRACIQHDGGFGKLGILADELVNTLATDTEHLRSLPDAD